MKLSEWVSGEFKNWIWGVVQKAAAWYHAQNTPFMKMIGVLWLGVVAITGLVWWAYLKTFAALTDFISTGLPTLSGALVPYYVFLNRFLPLSESFAGMVVLFNVWLCVVVLRWVKSFVPTVSN